MKSNNDTENENIFKILADFWGKWKIRIRIITILTSNIYAYEEESNKRDSYVLSQTFIYFTSSISCRVFTAKP